MKKAGKTTRPFRYDLNQIPYDYTVKVRNRFKGLDLIDRVPDNMWNKVHDVEQQTGIKTISWEKKCRKAKSRPGADCGSDHELLITKFRLKLKKAGKTTRSFKYEPNQIPNYYTVK